MSRIWNVRDAWKCDEFSFLVCSINSLRYLQRIFSLPDDSTTDYFDARQKLGAFEQIVETVAFFSRGRQALVHENRRVTFVTGRPSPSKDTAEIIQVNEKGLVDEEDAVATGRDRDRINKQRRTVTDRGRWMMEIDKGTELWNGKGRILWYMRRRYRNRREGDTYTAVILYNFTWTMYWCIIVVIRGLLVIQLVGKFSNLNISTISSKKLINYK